MVNTVQDTPERHPRHPADLFPAVVAEPTFADAILDRIIHNVACRLDPQGDSMRKLHAAEPAEAPLDRNKDYEKNAVEHGPPFTWSQGESLDELARPERTTKTWMNAGAARNLSWAWRMLSSATTHRAPPALSLRDR